jgi:hypothetical protein
MTRVGRLPQQPGTWALSRAIVAHERTHVWPDLLEPPAVPALLVPEEETAMTNRYDIHLDDKYGHLALIDVAAEGAVHEPWFNQTLTTVNDSVVRLGVIEGDFHWHKHDDQDESSWCSRDSC